MKGLRRKLLHLFTASCAISPERAPSLGSELDQLSAEQLLAYYVLTHHYCRDGVVRAAAGSTRTAPTGWAPVSDKADQVVRDELVSDAAFAKMFDTLEDEPVFVKGLLMNR